MKVQKLDESFIQLHISRGNPKVAMATYSVYDIENLLENKPMLYRIGYDDNEGLWFIGDGHNLIHYYMFDAAYNQGLYRDQERLIKEWGGLNAYIYAGQDGSELYATQSADIMEPFLYYMISIPNDYPNFDKEEEEILDDGYNSSFEYEKFTIYARDCDFTETPLYASLGIPVDGREYI